jgi:uncharacterized integral membrane protein (TIGR00698 family)
MANFSPKISLACLILLLILVVTGLISIGASLLLGIGYALVIGNSFQVKTHWASAIILKASIVLLGFSINVAEVYKTASAGFIVTVISISFALMAGLLLGRLFKVEKTLAFLIASGTAICGGSAIAAVAPVIKAKSGHIIVAISIVFLLNAAGLLLFPYFGELLQLDQQQFGLWAALAIHDTSSVVGAATTFGEESLQIATTTKLARALWIIPLVLLASFAFHSEKRTATLPLFIVLFVLASVLTSLVQLPDTLISMVPAMAKTGMAISLFLIGAGFNRATLSEIQWSALWQGVILWILVSLFSLLLIFYL